MKTQNAMYGLGREAGVLICVSDLTASSANERNAVARLWSEAFCQKRWVSTFTPFLRQQMT